MWFLKDIFVAVYGKLKVCLDANGPERTQSWCMVGFINSSLCNGAQLINPNFLYFWRFQMLLICSSDKWGPFKFSLWACFANLVAQFKCPEFFILHQSARVFFFSLWSLWCWCHPCICWCRLTIGGGMQPKWPGMAILLLDQIIKGSGHLCKSAKRCLSYCPA